MIKKKIDVNDHYRALLSETLPYETLFPFSNYYFHSYIKQQWGNFPNSLKSFIDTNDLTIPYDYEINHRDQEKRKVSIMHLAAQRRVCDFYKNYDQIMVEYCTKSPFSIRKPVKIADHYYEKELKVEKQDDLIEHPPIEIEPDPFEQQQINASSYFCYEEYDLLYKFFESWKFINYEKKFLFYSTSDISKCFYNIYTHSISWAVKSKSFGKNHSINKSCFESDFDKIMQLANYNETNGIIVGPEVSRIFAEVLFQAIDKNIRKELDSKGLKFNQHYMINRYVDDFFIFANSESDIDLIQSVISKCTQEYKLYVNKSKVKTINRPFVSPQSKAKHACSEEVNSYFFNIYRNKDNLASFKNLDFFSRAFIKKIGTIVDNNSCTFSDVSRYLITAVCKETLKILRSIIKSKSLEDSDKQKIESLLRNIIEIIFFIYSMDCNFRLTSKLGGFYLSMIEISKILTDGQRHVVFKKFFDNATKHIKDRINMHSGKAGIEEFNLLIMLAQIEDKYKVSEANLLDWFFDKKKSYAVDYFTVVSVLYYIKDNKEYASIYDSILLEIASYFKKFFNSKKSHDILLLIDITSCPWIDEKAKKEIIKSCLKKFFPSKTTEDTLNKETKRFLTFVSKRTWFFDWNCRNHLERILQKKELRTAY